MSQEYHNQSQEELELQRVFDATSDTLGTAGLSRLAARAAEIPETEPVSRSWLSRLLRGRGLLPAAAVATMAGVLALVLWLAPSSGETDIAQPALVAMAAVTPGGAGGAPTPAGDEVAIVETDPLAGLDPDWEVDDSLALLDPPHLAYTNVDDSVWLEIYGEMLGEKTF